MVVVLLFVLILRVLVLFRLRGGLLYNIPTGLVTPSEDGVAPDSEGLGVPYP